MWQCSIRESALSTDGGKTWVKTKESAGSSGCIVAFADTKAGWIGNGTNFKKTADGGTIWEKLTLPEGVTGVVATALRTPKDGYLVDIKGSLYITKDGGETWTSHSLGLDNPKILDYASGPFVNATPQAAVRFFDANNGLVVLGLSGETNMVALRTADGGKTWKKENLTGGLGKPYLSRDGKFLTLNLMGKGVTVLEYK